MKTPYLLAANRVFLLFKENKNYFNSYQEFLKICPVLEF